MTIGSLGYVLNDALIRDATEQGLDVYQALFLRSVGISALLAGFVVVRRETISKAQFGKPLVIRVLAEVVAAAMFFGALVHMEFANAQTILLIVPFAVTLAAALFLGERVSRKQYLTVAAGFVGVLFVVQPATDSFSLWSIVVLASAGILVVREFATRRVPSDTSASFVALVTAIGLAILTGAISLFTGWGEITPAVWVTLGFACLSLIVGYIFTIETVRVGDLSVSAPFRYTTLLGAVVFGYVFFDEIPNSLTLIGCSIILLAGCTRFISNAGQARPLRPDAGLRPRSTQETARLSRRKATGVVAGSSSSRAYRCPE